MFCWDRSHGASAINSIPRQFWPLQTWYKRMCHAAPESFESETAQSPGPIEFAVYGQHQRGSIDQDFSKNDPRPRNAIAHRAARWTANSRFLTPLGNQTRCKIPARTPRSPPRATRVRSRNARFDQATPLHTIVHARCLSRRNRLIWNDFAIRIEPRWLHFLQVTARFPPSTRVRRNHRHLAGVSRP